MSILIGLASDAAAGAPLIPLLLAQASAPGAAPTPSPTTVPAAGPIIGLILWAVALALAAIIIWRTRAYRPSTINGPLRLDPRELRAPYIVALAIGLIAWVMVPAIYAAATLDRERPASTQPTTQGLPMSPREMVTLSAVAGFVPLALMVIVYRVLRHQGLCTIGMTRSGIVRAVPAAILGSLVAIPLIYWVGLLLMWLFRQLMIEHPDKHQLLLLLDESRDALTKVIMVIAAVVIAPLFEEVLFRGHLQTLLAHFAARQRVPLPNPPPQTNPSSSVPPVQSADPLAPQFPTAPTPVQPLSYQPQPPPLWESRPGVAARWGAVLITSFLFAIVHELWTAPAIFVLSICFGYIYERTGNLWVPILMHVAFNGVSIILSRMVG